MFPYSLLLFLFFLCAVFLFLLFFLVFHTVYSPLCILLNIVARFFYFYFIFFIETNIHTHTRESERGPIAEKLSNEQRGNKGKRLVSNGKS